MSARRPQKVLDVADLLLDDRVLRQHVRVVEVVRECVADCDQLLQSSVNLAASSGLLMSGRGHRSCSGGAAWSLASASSTMRATVELTVVVSRLAMVLSCATCS